MAEAMAWVSRITTIAITMVLPAVAGHFTDRFFGTRFLILVGAAIGLVLGFWQLLAIAQKNQDNSSPTQSKSDEDPPSDSSVQ